LAKSRHRAARQRPESSKIPYSSILTDDASGRLPRCAHRPHVLMECGLAAGCSHGGGCTGAISADADRFQVLNTGSENRKLGKGRWIYRREMSRLIEAAFPGRTSRMRSLQLPVWSTNSLGEVDMSIHRWAKTPFSASPMTLRCQLFEDKALAERGGFDFV
jgi:hypothetical protein